MQIYDDDASCLIILELRLVTYKKEQKQNRLIYLDTF